MVDELEGTLEVGTSDLQFAIVTFTVSLFPTDPRYCPTLAVSLSVSPTSMHFGGRKFPPGIRFPLTPHRLRISSVGKFLLSSVDFCLSLSS